MIIRSAESDDAASIVKIYNHYVLNSHSTFETEAIDDADIRKQITEGMYPFVVAVENRSVDGYAFAHEYRSRPAYRSTAEVSVYVRAGSEGQGMGHALYEELFSRLRETAIHVVVAGIALPNEASVKLHESFGMRKVAHFSEVGRKFDRWIDVGYWEIVL